MIKAKKFLSIILTLAIIFTFAMPTFAATSVAVERNADSYSTESSFTKSFYNFADKLVNVLMKCVVALFPTPSSWADNDKTDGFFEGTTEFLSEPSENSCWELGFDSRSILLPEDEIIGKMYVGGSISLKNKYATSIEDDLKVHTVALSDGSGRGITVFASIDCYGLALSDVRTIREMLAEFSAEKGINSINISALHQHSAVDTLGMNGNIWEMAFINPLRVSADKQTNSGKNEAYMKNLFEKCTQSITSAVNVMEKGKLYFGTADATEYIDDKRQPYVNDPNFNRLRFVPDDGSRETWVVTSSIHCVGNGAADTVITSDYPYYAEQTINDSTGANVMFVLGAEQSNTQIRNEKTVVDYREDMTRLEKMAGFGKSIGSALLKIDNDTEISPLLNIRLQQIYLPISNPILTLAGKTGMVGNIVVKRDGENFVLSEIGYMEIGDDLAFALIPGELASEIAYGGCLDSEYSWTGEDWEYPSLQEIIAENGSDRTLRVIGLCNDQIGYIVPDNNYMSILYDGSQSTELVSLGSKTASTIVAAFGSSVPLHHPR